MPHQFPQQLSICYQRCAPQTALARWRDEELLVVDFEFSPYWLDKPERLPLTAVYARNAQGQLVLGVSRSPLPAITSNSGVEALLAWAKNLGFACYSTAQPLYLAPQAIAKPWGQEIWYTGVEERGVCCFSDGVGHTPIPWLQAAMPDHTLGQAGKALVLLKILDPKPEPVTGDLYFELHRQKREVYVVTHVDTGVWPDGVGAIKYGFSPEVIAQHPDEQAFRQAYLAAVQAYETIRRQIDESAQLDASWHQQERELRAVMDGFIHRQPLQVGDVVKVPTGLPHSLQHGVRTVEFQTPVYERLILSFAQQVLTQNHWDTAAAVDEMLLLPPPVDPPQALPAEPGVSRERIVDFDDFQVQRIVCSNEAWQLEDCASYRLLMVVSGEISIGACAIGPEQAVILPADNAYLLQLKAASAGAVLLLAIPRSAAVEPQG